MRKWLLRLFVFILFLVAGGVGAYWYVSPDRQLNLKYSEVPIGDRAVEMLRRLSVDLILSEADVNNLAKQSIAQNPEYTPDATITGADFHLQDNDRLVADINLKIADRIPVGLTITYQLIWNDPNLTAKVVGVKIKDLKLSASKFDDVIIPLGQQVPRPIRIEKVSVENGKLHVVFHKPGWKELQELLSKL